MTLFRSAWGPVELWLSDIETDLGRELVIQKYTRGNLANVQNRGDAVLTARCSILFDEFRGQQETGEDRINSMIALKEAGKPQLFTHPLRGTYLAEIGEFLVKTDQFGVSSGSATFVAVEDVGAVTVYPIGVSLDGGAVTIEARADELDAQLADVGVDSAISKIVRAAGVAFDRATSTRDVLVKLSDVSERVNQEIDNLKLAADVLLWPALKAFVMANEAARSAADEITGDASGLMTVRIDAPTSLRRLCADLYGGLDAAEGYEEALSLNDVRTPAAIPSGTILTMRQPSALQRAA